MARPWYRKLRFVAPIAAVGGLLVGSAAGSAGASSSQSTPTAAATVTVTASAAPTTLTRTVEKAATATATTPAAVQAVLKAWTDAGPQPDKQRAAMASLRAQWPTLAQALEKATGVHAPAAVAAPAPAPPAAATIPGDGTYEVGTDVKPGRYKSSPAQDGVGECYWARQSSSNDSDIIDNHLGKGTMYVTILRSDSFFRTDGCNDWVRVK